MYPTYHVICFGIQLTATEEIVDTSNSGSGFVGIGYISGVHGLQGEIRVKPSTDFPELRFLQVKLHKLLPSDILFSVLSMYLHID